ncbi:outer membrane beta-barrel domain-containing protein [Oceanicoccus sp. KOV_DT_Chl]|uniref:outer membrane beta-barrel domain-containing protein n=1 Tax=Oceanicoccus sp. KOV_DT_Chl TaxID=1904639 RepID=UPI000C7E03AF|nr:outer membrane beta-barrel domain-containing protein [Oceanicoccus sp. KOV_DT_Chl]
MENWYQRFLLSSTLLASLCSPTWADEGGPIQVIEPEIDRRTIERAAIDTENIELSLFYGIISIEDFDSAEVIGLRAAWHVTDAIFFEASYGQAQGDLTSYEQISGGLPLFSDEDRDYLYYNLAVGWNIFPGEVFLFDHAFNSAFYLIGGAGSTDFVGDKWFTVTFGAGYRLLLTDSIAWHIDVRDHFFDREIFTIEETTNNIEFTTGISVFF